MKEKSDVIKRSETLQLSKNQVSAHNKTFKLPPKGEISFLYPK